MFEQLVEDLSRRNIGQSQRLSELLDDNAGTVIPSFLARLIQERPHFIADAAFGLAVMELYSTWSFWLKDRPSLLNIETFPRPMREFAMLTVVKRSTKAAFERAKVNNKIFEVHVLVDTIWSGRRNFSFERSIFDAISSTPPDESEK